MAFLSSPSICAACLRAAQRATPRRTPASPFTAIRQPQHVSAQRRRILSAPRVFSTAAPTLTTRRTFAIATGTPTPQSTQPQPQSPPQPSTPQPARAIQNPRTTPLGDPMTISLSPRAAHRLAAITESDKNPSLALRVSIESGGCHGFQYLMNLVDLSASPATEEDTVFEGDKGAKVVVDEASLELLNGSTVDYTMELIGSQFKVTGIPGATSSCGCGTSFDIKL